MSSVVLGELLLHPSSPELTLTWSRSVFGLTPMIDDKRTVPVVWWRVPKMSCLRPQEENRHGWVWIWNAFEDIIGFEQIFLINPWCMTSMWPGDIIMTLHCLQRQIKLTFCWPCCANSVATPIQPFIPIRKSISHRLWVESSVSGVIRSTLIHVSASFPRIRFPLALGPAFLDLWPLHLGCELAAFLALWSDFDESHDYAFALRSVMEASRCGGSLWTVPPLWFMSLSGELMEKTKKHFLTFWSFVLMTLSFAALRPGKRFLIYMDFMVPLTMAGTDRRPVQTV